MTNAEYGFGKREDEHSKAAPSKSRADQEKERKNEKKNIKLKKT